MNIEARRRLERFWWVTAPFLSAVMVLLLGVIAFGGASREGDATRLLEHTHSIIDQNRQILSRLVDAETGERGFIITGDSLYLDPYHGAAAEVNARVHALRQLAVGDSAQQARVDTLEDLVRRRLVALEGRIATRKRAGFESARAELLASGGGKAVMDSVRRVIGAIEVHEQRMLAPRTASQSAYERAVLWIVGLGAIIAALIALGISLTLSRAATTESRLAGEMKAQADELELANHQLQDQAAEMEMLNEELQSTNERLEERTAEAEEANRVKAEFLANMSHDLRTPLNAIIGYVDLLEAGVRGPIADEQLADIQRIKRSGSHLLGLINEVLDFAKVEAGQLQLRIEDVPLRSVFAELQPLVDPQVKAKGLQFRTESDRDLVVRADREKLDQILVNLVGNAIKFTDTHGRIEVVSRPERSWVRIEVRDSGEGIPADQLDAVFAPFVQVERRHRPREPQGIGLGLSISRHLARAMGGELTVTSALGEGSTFTLRLPRG